MTMARSIMHGNSLEVTFPEDNVYPLGIPSLVVQDEEDIPTQRFIIHRQEPFPWLELLALLGGLVLVMLFGFAIIQSIQG